MVRALRALALAMLMGAAVSGTAIAADPAAGLPSDMVVYGQMSHEAAQDALGMAALPPVVGLVPDVPSGRFGHLDELLSLPPGTAEQAALHLDRAAFGAGPAGAMLVVSFGQGFEPASLLTGMTQDPKAPVPLGPNAALAVRDQFLCIATPPLLQRFMAGGYPTLADQPAFQAARAKEGKADAWFYADVPALLQLARMTTPPTQRQEMEMTLDVFGLAGAESLTASFDIGAPSMQGVLRLGEKDNGLLSLLPGGPLDLVSVVPDGPSAALLFEWHDASAFYGRLMDLVTRFNAKYGDHSDEQAMADFEQRAGLKLADVAAQLGPGLAVYLPAPAQDGMLHVEQAVAVLPLKDVDGFSASVARIAMGTTGKPPIQQTVAGLRAQVLAMPPVTIVYLKDRAVLALDSAAAEGYVKWAASGGPAMAKEAPDASAMLYMDMGLLFRSYPQPQSGTQISVTLSGEDRDVRFGASVEGATPSVVRLYVGMVGMMGAMMMPALERARFQAQQSTSVVHLHQIGLGLMMYSQAHNRFPDDLSALISEGYLDDPSLLLDPHDSSPAHVGAAGYPCSYEYPGYLPPNLPPQFIIACSRKGIRPDGRVVLYADCAVQVVSERDLATAGAGRGMSLRQCYQWLLDQAGDAVTPKEKASWRAFYLGEAATPSTPARAPSAAVPTAMAGPLARARMEANKSRSRGNLHMIGIGITMYRNAHDDQFPATLAPLVAEGYLADASTLVDPADQHPVKHPGEDFPSSYEYAGAINMNAPAALIIAYSRKGLYPGGRNVLYVDNAVQWVKEEDLHRPGRPRGMSLGECYQWLLDHDKGTMTDAQKARLKAFYD